MNKQKSPTPSQFYREIRPEFFSDSKIVAKVILPREQLDYEISQISTNQKHDSFETLSRKLAEKLISPNLIPQVGPTGGGDGKTDSESYPVSNFISNRWYISNNKWNENENWAFAISAKKDWKPKVKSDVKKIVETNRGYTKIFFFSNQKISSRNKTEVQDQIRKEYHVELIILDAEWILEKVYSSQLLNVVIESLNLSITYLEEKIIGSKDSERIKELEELENQINSPNRFFEIDFQLVEDCLESAIISRMIELPKAEVIGKFERALKFANRLNNIQLKIRIHYQLGWTLINWYDEYKLFYNEFLNVKELVNQEPNINNIEFYLNLFNILITISNVEEVKDILVVDYEIEGQDLKTFLTKCSQNQTKPSTSLLASFYLAFFQIRIKLENEISVSEELINLKEYFKLSISHLDIPFEQLKSTINVFGEILADSEDFDNLIDTIAEIESVRISDLTSGQTYLNRGTTKLKNNLIRESLIYFGKASRKLAKDETQTEFYYCLMLLSEAYSRLDLYWASYNALVSATNIFVNNWATTGNLNKKFLKSVESILKNETIIGRVPVLLCWYELYLVLQRYFQPEVSNNNTENLPTEHLTDACMAIRLLNLSFEEFENLKYLPNIFKTNELWHCLDASLYLLGYENLIELDESKTSLRKENFSEYYNKLANQPFVEQIAYGTNFLNSKEVIIESQVLGIRIEVFFNQNIHLLILAENILAYFESFLATSFEEVFPVSDNIKIYIEYKEITENFKLETINKNHFKIYIKNLIIYNGENFKNLIDEILPQILSGNYLFRDIKEFLNNLYEKDEVHERLSIIVEHNSFLTNVLTDKPKFFLQDWITNDVSNFNLLRRESPISINRELPRFSMNDSKEGMLKFKDITHKKIKVETVINIELWDKAQWKAFGFFVSHEVSFGLVLIFEKIEYGKKIFEEWIEKYGENDNSEKISITIIKGIDKKNPYWYKVFISKKIEKSNMKDGQVITLPSRFHRMEAQNSNNLDNLIKGYNMYKKFILVPAHIDSNFEMAPVIELGILKTELTIKNAWEIGIHDVERVVITEGDDPIIPNDITDAPILEVLKEKSWNR